MKRKPIVISLTMITLSLLFLAPFASGATITSITVYEQTMNVLPFTFLLGDPRLGKNPSFSLASYDFTYFEGGTEIYDVYISNNNASANLQGAYLTIDCILETGWGRPTYVTGTGAGHNIDAVSIDYSDGTHQWATEVTAYTLGYSQTLFDANPYAALGVPNNSPTYMGDQFSSLTVGFGLSQPIVGAPVPIPPSVWLLGSGLVGLVGLRRMFFRN